MCLWMQCRGTYCSTGHQIRKVSCVGKDISEGVQNTYHCLQQERPQVTRMCSMPCTACKLSGTSTVLHIKRASLLYIYVCVYINNYYTGVYKCVCSMVFILPHVPAAALNETCVDRLPARYCQYVVEQNYCSTDENYAENCCETCKRRQQPQ